MRYTYLLLLLLLLASGYAQDTLWHLPVAGHRQYLAYCTFDSALVQRLCQPDAGAAQTWDARTLAADGRLYTMRYGRPDTTPAFDKFPKANLVRYDVNDKGEKSWYYYRAFPAELDLLGSADETHTYPMNPPKMHMEARMYLGYTVETKMKYSTAVTLCDATGTLHLPDDKTHRVIRVRYCLRSNMMGTIDYDDCRYVFYDLDSGLMMLEIIPSFGYCLYEKY